MSEWVISPFYSGGLRHGSVFTSSTQLIQSRSWIGCWGWVTQSGHTAAITSLLSATLKKTRWAQSPQQQQQNQQADEVNLLSGWQLQKEIQYIHHFITVCRARNTWLDKYNKTSTHVLRKNRRTNYILINQPWLKVSLSPDYQKKDEEQNVWVKKHCPHKTIIIFKSHLPTKKIFTHFDFCLFAAKHS